MSKVTKKPEVKVKSVLVYLMATESLLIDITRSPHDWIRKQMGYDDYKSKSLFYYLIKKGLISIEAKAGGRAIRLTRKGELEALLAKSVMAKPVRWDGKWRVVIFDIPESARHYRNRLRRLLKQRGFIQLQASVFISPYPLNREAISYLKETGLIKYIRILKVEEVDDDRDLRKKFKL